MFNFIYALLNMLVVYIHLSYHMLLLKKVNLSV